MTPSAHKRPALPLFYERPEPLHPQRHGRLRLGPARDMRFTARANAVPLAGGEFASAFCAYPIVFAGAPMRPMAVLGFGQRNLFLDEDGRWATEAPTPAYIRRYPFILIEGASADGLALGVDRACPWLHEAADAASDEGVALFAADDEPAEAVRQALSLCAAYQAADLETQAFVQTLQRQQLLTPLQAHVVPRGGAPLTMGGFEVIDAARLRAMDGAVLQDWAQRHWLEWAHYHLASTASWRGLLERHGSHHAAA